VSGRERGEENLAKVRSYLAGLGVSLVTDLPSSPVIVWVMGILGLLVHLTGRNGSSAAKAVAHQ